MRRAKLDTGGEATIWRGTPDRAHYVLAAAPTVLFGVIWLILPTWFAVQAWQDGRDVFSSIILVPFLLIGFCALLYPLFRLLEHKNVAYV